MPEHRRYAAHEALVQAARARPELWRLVLGVLMIAAVSLLLTQSAMVLLAQMFPGAWLAGLGDGGNPAAMLVLLGGFGFVTAGVAAAARFVHHRSLASVTGPLKPLVRQFARVSLYLAALGAVLALLPPYGMGPPLTPNLAPGLWLALLPLSLTAVLIQTSAEEIVFRGYLQQALAARFRHPLVWLVLPSALFALGHFLPSEAGDNALLIALWAGAFGVLMADLTARAGTLGPAIAVHFFNNFTALLLFASPTSLYGLALFLMPFDMSDTEGLRPWMTVDFALMLVSWLTARLAIRG
ncbi:lysostaphin resistance A-like protein [Roseobacteraceae bacterium NS-SX3]